MIRSYVKIITLIVLLLLLLLLFLTAPSSSSDFYHGGSIGGGTPNGLSYAIRGGACGGCGCGLRPDGRPFCDMTGPINYGDE